MGKGSTKERVLGAALRLFNEKGTAAVSTNHIAEAAGISPGNLYYHYRNKEEIIAGLWEYRFFYRELAALTRRDEGIRDRYLKVRERGLSGTEALLRGFV